MGTDFFAFHLSDSSSSAILHCSGLPALNGCGIFSAGSPPFLVGFSSSAGDGAAEPQRSELGGLSKSHQMTNMRNMLEKYRDDIIAYGQSIYAYHIVESVLSLKLPNLLLPTMLAFLDASSHLYMRECPSVCRSVGNPFFFKRRK